MAFATAYAGSAKIRCQTFGKSDRGPDLACCIDVLARTPPVLVIRAAALPVPILACDVVPVDLIVVLRFLLYLALQIQHQTAAVPDIS